MDTKKKRGPVHAIREDEGENLARLLGVFKRRGWKSRQAITEAFDERADWEAVEGIGLVLAPLMRRVMRLSERNWGLLTGLAYYSGEAPHHNVEGSGE